MNLINPVSFSAAQNYSNKALKSNLKQSSASQINNAINFGSTSAQVIKSPVTQKLAASAVAMVAGLAGLAAVSAKDLITKNQTDETANTPNNNTTTNVENASQNKPNNVNAPIEEENNSTKPNSEKEIRITKEDLIQELKKSSTNVENASQNKPNNVNAPIEEENNSTKPNSEKEIRITKEDLIQELKKPSSEKEIRIAKEDLIQELKKPSLSIEEIAEKYNVSCTYVVKKIEAYTNSKVEVEKGSSLEKKLKEERIQREKEFAKEAKRIAVMEKVDEILSIIY